MIFIAWLIATEQWALLTTYTAATIAIIPVALVADRRTRRAVNS